MGVGYCRLVFAVQVIPPRKIRNRTINSCAAAQQKTFVLRASRMYQIVDRALSPESDSL